MLITYIKEGTPAQIVLERGSAMTRATFVIFWPKLSSFIDWCCCYTQVSYTGSQEPLVLYSDVSRQKENIHCWRIRKPKLHYLIFLYSDVSRQKQNIEWLLKNQKNHSLIIFFIFYSDVWLQKENDTWMKNQKTKVSLFFLYSDVSRQKENIHCWSRKSGRQW